MEKKKHNLDHHIRHGGKTLLRVPGLPSKLRRELRELFTPNAAEQSAHEERACRLLDLYERAVRIITANPASSEFKNRDIKQTTEKELLSRLSDELQTQITELDFDGEAGHSPQRNRPSH